MKSIIERPEDKEKLYDCLNNNNKSFMIVFSNLTSKLEYFSKLYIIYCLNATNKTLLVAKKKEKKKRKEKGIIAKKGKMGLMEHTFKKH